MLADTIAAATDTVFPWPDKQLLTGNGAILLGALALVTKVILARIKQATDLAKIAAETLPQRIDAATDKAQEAVDEARQAKELSRPTGNGFATQVIQMMQAQHIEVMSAVAELRQRVTALENKDTAA